MKRALNPSPDDTEPPKKRHKPNKSPTPPLSDNEPTDKPEMTKSSTTMSNASCSSSESDEDNECCICFSKIDLPIKLDCGHQFCFLCLKEIRMQSSTTFNIATLNCTTPDSDDDDGDDDTNTNTNTNTNAPKKKKKPVEKFSCPYCRREFDVTVIDKATMKKTDWMGDTTKKKKNAAQEVIIWQYSGRKGGWWAYQKGHKKQLEKGYQKFLKQLKDEQDKEEKAKDDMDKNKNGGSKYDTNKNKEGEDDDDDEDDDLGEEEGLLTHQCMIEIGVRKYVCDFAQMIQFDYEFPTRKRRIRRRVETKHSLEKSDSLKGCAGKFFNDGNKDKNKNRNNRNKNRKRKRSDD
eukprot:CAMPEP_0201573860 /NCGR_PEP_ID=MMETSP0190_2-20130828/17948_1 /ASSEMBLY_ACC=CAM_ASM_000263 /TAXON_ID=37353 /ORGANISM="Rosalina sp." /LENGTH=346 /DNA_ID=CAMNT_0048001323 /DNA_START=74 /DNA_END=1111 /DNA_ORIENTATION=-